MGEKELNPSRRRVLKGGVAGAALVWSAPAVVSVGAASAEGTPVTPPPPPPPCTPGNVVSYQATGWRYKQVATGAEPGFEAVGYPEAGFSTGQAAFGSGGGCPLVSTVATTWSINTDMLLRRTVNIPAGATQVRVFWGIDNDFDVYWDGVLVSSGVHDGCASLDNFSVIVTSTPGDHLLAFRAKDRGGESYVDVRVEVTC